MIGHVRMYAVTITDLRGWTRCPLSRGQGVGRSFPVSIGLREIPRLAENKRDFNVAERDRYGALPRFGTAESLRRLYGR